MPAPGWKLPTMKTDGLRGFLDEQVEVFNSPGFIPDDPVSVPHQFSLKQDIEIAGFIAAIFSWGNRKTIIRKANEFLRFMDMAPYDFLIHHQDSDLLSFDQFVHRTFQPTDALYFIDFLSRHYKEHDSLEDLFLAENGLEDGLNNFNTTFFSTEHAPQRTRKHIPSPRNKSTCKRLNMFLRWMVRSDDKGVDFGIWNQIKPQDLICPIDIHVGNISRELGLLNRKQNDWQAAVELTANLKSLDESDPVKYDFALFGLGVNGRISDVIDRKV